MSSASLASLELQLMGQKFDIVVGNPPYQEASKTRDGESSRSSVRLWERFVEFSLSAVVDSGYVALVTPSGWVSKTSYSNPLITVNKIIFSDLSQSVSDAFDGVGGTMRFSTCILQKSNSVGGGAFKFDDGIVQLELDNMPFVPVKSNLALDYSICSKLAASKVPALEWKRREAFGSAGDIEIAIPRAKSPTWPIRVHTDGSGFGYICTTKNRGIADIIAHNLNLKLHQRLRWVLRPGMALVSSITQIPIPTDQKYTDASLAQLFGFSNDEHVLIASFGNK